MPPLDFTQLGIAAIVAGLLWWFLNKIVGGKPLHTDAEVEVLRERIFQAEADKKTMAAQNASLATALAASNTQVQTALDLATKALKEE